MSISIDQEEQNAMHKQVIENLENMRIEEHKEDDNNQSNKSLKPHLMSLNASMVSDSQINNISSMQSCKNSSQNDSGLFFVTNLKTVGSTKNEKKRNSSLEFEEKVQANPDKYFDTQVDKIREIKSEILRNSAQCEEVKGIFKRGSILSDSEVIKETRNIEISIEQFLKRLKNGLIESDQNIGFLDKQLNSVVKEDKPILDCLASFEHRVSQMEKMIGIVPEEYQSQQEQSQQAQTSQE